MEAQLDRRAFLGGGTLLAGTLAACEEPGEAVVSKARPSDATNSWRGNWGHVRSLFPLSPEVTHLSALLIASHPRPVAEAIAGYRGGLDADPVRYLEENNEPLQRKAIEAAAEYAGADPADVALVDSTTQGVGSQDAWQHVRPTIPSFIDDAVWANWLQNRPLTSAGRGQRFTPGGFKAFEHMWALPAAFELHREIGRAEIAARTAMLARRTREGLAAMSHVRLVTPSGEALSAGIVSFDVEGMPAESVKGRLREHGVIASAAPSAVQHARLTPCI